MFNGRTVCKILEHPDSIGEPGGGDAGGPVEAPRPEDIIHWPQLEYRDGIGLCITLRRETGPNLATSPRAVEAEQRFLDLFGDYDLCPGVTPLPTNPHLTARRAIEEFLPAPANPEIDPGHAITGRPAYLETKSNLHPPRQTRSTPLGDIHVTFSGRYTIEWGDGTTTHATTEGQPWPHGTITHTWTHSGRYTVTVTTTWTASWSIGATTGEITDGLTTTAHLRNFEVRQLQAVRDR